MKPEISFDIYLGKGGNANTVSQDVTQNVEAKLAQLRDNPSEMNKQTFFPICIFFFFSFLHKLSDSERFVGIIELIYVEEKYFRWIYIILFSSSFFRRGRCKKIFEKKVFLKDPLIQRKMKRIMSKNVENFFFREQRISWYL